MWCSRCGSITVGTLTHGSSVNFSGELYDFKSYGVNKETELIDYDELTRQAQEHQPKLIVAGASAYPRFFDFARIREIADSVGAYMMVDMAHVAGMVAVGLHPSPVPYADVVTSTTHKTLRGPRGGLILYKEAMAKKIDKAVFPGTQGGPLMHIIAAKAVRVRRSTAPRIREVPAAASGQCQGHSPRRCRNAGCGSSPVAQTTT